MNYLIVKDGIISNIIVCADDKTADKFGAVQFYDGARIGDKYNPTSKPEQTPSNIREYVYNTLAIIEFGGSMLTVTQAAQLWQYYSAEGDAEKADNLTKLIAEAKAIIRNQYPDEEVSA